jgi:reactive chlorine resistance protein C
MNKSILYSIAGLEEFGILAVRYGIVIVFLWIGALKFTAYEADGIVPFVANSPFMSEFYNHPEQYKKHMNPEGELIPANHSWHNDNNTYGFSYGLGAVLIILALLVAFYRIIPLTSMIASMLMFIMTIGTLSFLITTPEAWVPHLGDPVHGVPYLSGRGRLVLKDIVILGGAILNMSESARLYLSKQKAKLS